MKKRIALALVIALVFSFAMTACSNQQKQENPSTPGNSSTDAPSPEPVEEAYKFTDNISIVVPYNAGGGVDTTIRMLLEAGLQDALGTTVSVENVAGGNTLIGAQQVLGAPADGYTVFVNTCAAFIAAPQMYGNPYTMDDWSYITTLGLTELIVAGGPAAPAKTVEDLIAYGAANPDGVTVGCAGYGDISALGAYITLAAMGVNCQLVPYDGAAESVAACLGGHVQYVCCTASTIASHCEEGTMTALYETGTMDENALGVPSITTLGYPDAATPYYRLVAVRKDTPAEVVDALRAAFKSALEDPNLLATMAESKQVIQGVVNDPNELLALVERDYAAYGEVVQNLNLQS